MVSRPLGKDRRYLDCVLLSTGKQRTYLPKCAETVRSGAYGSNCFTGPRDAPDLNQHIVNFCWWMAEEMRQKHGLGSSLPEKIDRACRTQIIRKSRTVSFQQVGGIAGRDGKIGAAKTFEYGEVDADYFSIAVEERAAGAA